MTEPSRCFSSGASSDTSARAAASVSKPSISPVVAIRARSFGQAGATRAATSAKRPLAKSASASQLSTM
jgi:hypothetical protein